MKRHDPHEVSRQVMVSLVLEPLAEKEGCTTRSNDLDETIRLQHLQVAGINVGRYFYELVERVNESGGQPSEYFDLALEAIKDSQKNLQNSGKYINQGLITMFFHVVLASLLTEGDGVDVCRHVPTVLKNSSLRDADCRSQFLQLVWSKSKNQKKREFPQLKEANLFKFYLKLADQSRVVDYESGVIWSTQLTQALPIVQEMYLVAKKSLDKGLIVSMEDGYKRGTELLSINSPGFVADYTGIVNFLLLRELGGEAVIL